MTETKCGMVAICGRPNVGKSTLLNTLVGEKVAIVTPKPQTTRNQIRGIVERGTCQIILLDTPGLHRPKNRLGEYMTGVVKASVAGVDAVLLMVEPIPNVGEPEMELIHRLRGLDIPVVLVINKTDTLPRKETLLAVMDTYRQAMNFAAILPLSAQTGDGVEDLTALLAGWMPQGRWLFPEGMSTDQPERQVMAELLREKLLLCLDKEIPHGTAVEIGRFSQRDNGIIDVEATIFCEKASHKGIIIGKGGQRLKKISSQARQEMERFMGEKVYLQTWVKVRENWRDNLNLIQSFGYRDE